MKKVVLLSNLISYTYNFRKEILSAFCKEGYRVTVVADNDDSYKWEALENMGCELIHVPFHGKGKDIKQDFALVLKYQKILLTVRPDIVFSFTIKPNLYGGFVSRLKRIPYIPMITGLGELEKPGKLQTLLVMMHKQVMPFAKCIYFQNNENIIFFNEHKIRYHKKVLLPGSGINLGEHVQTEYPKDGIIEFAFISRLTAAKGIEQYLDAAEEFYKQGLKAEFHIAGKCNPEYESRVQRLNGQGIIRYHGLLSNVRDLIQEIHCLVLPTYHPEGISNVLLEAAACGRPVVCTNRSGCREVVEDRVNGLYCEAKNSKNLISKLVEFYSLPWQEKERMGHQGREKVEKSFSREIVVRHYLDAVEDV